MAVDARCLPGPASRGRPWRAGGGPGAAYVWPRGAGRGTGPAARRENCSARISAGQASAAFTEIGRESRRVLEVTDTASRQTMRLREPGPYVTTEVLGRFAADYRRLLADATAVGVLCGTLPAGLPPEIYGNRGRPGRPRPASR